MKWPQIALQVLSYGIGYCYVIKISNDHMSNIVPPKSDKSASIKLHFIVCAKQNKQVRKT